LIVAVHCCSQAFAQPLLDLYSPRARDSRPNVVLIFADDLGYGDLGVFGHPSFKTPHLDRMAAEGVRFTNFYTTCPYCAPSRAALMTGRYQFRSGVTRNPTPDQGITDVGLPSSEATIGDTLRPQRYRTCAIGKWHLGHSGDFLPTQHGFDEYLGILYSNDMRPVELVEGDGGVVEYPVVQALLTGKYTDRALEFIERNRHWPFFLYLPHAMPHKPLAASEQFYTPEPPNDLYADVIAELDWSIGQILERLRELKLDRQTLVVFTSDNGPFFGGSSGGLRGMKGSTFEGGFRVPMIAWMPGAIPEGRVVDAMASTLDIYPTVCGLAGVAMPDDRVIDGRDIWPLLSGQSDQSPHEALYCLRSDQLCTVRSGKWKLHVPAPNVSFALPNDWIDPRAPDGVTLIAQFEQPRPSQQPGVQTGDAPVPMMLFDLEADPSEQHNVADKHPAVVERLKRLFDSMEQQVLDASSSRNR
jgi:uncharacterized sulfatase